ncbi:MAG: hypothetical protein HFE61_10915 [Anaerotignum sp.]|nr:hypothetical protein [Anaerotignum sp.]
MKQTTVQVKFDSDRYTALLRYAGKKDVPVEKELTDTLERLYKRLVPADVREYIEDMEMENKEKSGSKKKAAAAENEPEEISHSAPPMAGI